MLKAFNLSEAEPNKQELNLSEAEVSKQNQEQTQVAADLGKNFSRLSLQQIQLVRFCR